MCVSVATATALCRAAMARAEPAMVDVHGAVWTGRNEYDLVPSAKRYELYEMSYAAKVLLQLCLRLELILLCFAVPFASVWLVSLVFV